LQGIPYRRDGALRSRETLVAISRMNRRSFLRSRLDGAGTDGGGCERSALGHLTKSSAHAPHESRPPTACQHRVSTIRRKASNDG
jgi:hypothetical protein